MRILVVDDNRDAANMLAVLLREEGYEVGAVYTAHDALTDARTRPPRVVLLDIGMPVMDGFELARALRDEECCRGAVLIAITGYSDYETTRRGAECGIDIHLEKPADAPQLVGLLRQIEAAAEGPA